MGFQSHLPRHSLLSSSWALALGNGQIKGSQTAGKKGKRVSPMRTGGLGRVAARGGQQVTLTRGDIAQGLSDSPSEADRRQA